MKKVSFILIIGALLFFSLCYQVKAQEYSENLTVTTLYPDSINFSQWSPENGSVSGSTVPYVYVSSLNKIDINNTENIEMRINDEIVLYHAYERGGEYLIQYEDPQFVFVNGSDYKIDVFVRDKGNFTASTSWQFVYQDTTPLGITFNNPQQGDELTQPFFWLNITTDENASCKYDLTECLDEYCRGEGKQQPTTPFAYTDGRNHLEEINLNEHQEKNTYKKYVINVSCYDEFNNYWRTGIMFGANLPNTPPYWLEEPQDQTIEQGTSLSYSVKAADADNDTLSYSLQNPEFQGNTLILTDDDYIDDNFEGRQILAIVADTLKDGETKTYTIDGKDYEVTAVFINGNNRTAELSVNGMLTNALAEGESEFLYDTIQIEINEILTNQREDIVEFYLVVYSGARIMIKAERQQDNESLILHDLKYRGYADEDLYVHARTSLKDYLLEPENMLTDNWDIYYAGLMKTGVAPIVFRIKENKTYELEFTNNIGQNYTFPLVSNYNSEFTWRDANGNYVLWAEPGTSANPLADNLTFIAKNDYFIVSDKNDNNNEKAVTTVLRYTGVNTSVKQITVGELGVGNNQYDYTGTDGVDATGKMNIAGKDHSFWVGADGDQIAVDLDGNGNLTAGTVVYVTVKGEGYIKMPTQAFTMDGMTSIVDPVGSNEALFTLTTPKEKFDDAPIDDETTVIGIVNSEKMFLSATGLISVPNVNDWRSGMTTYGVYLKYYTSNSSIEPRTLIIDYPLSMRGGQVFLTLENVETRSTTGSGETSSGAAGTATVSGESFEFRTASDNLGIGEAIKSVRQQVTEEDLYNLKTIILNTEEGSTQVKQYLNFENATAKLVYEPNSEGEVADYLKFDAGSNLFEYHLEFTEGAVSSIVNSELVDFIGKTINIMGNNFTFISAGTYGDNGIILVLTPHALLDPSVISINDSTGLISFTPPADWYGNVSVEVKASDGTDEISKTIIFTVLPKEENKPDNPKHGGGGGGGGGGAASTNNDWNCSEWSDCVNNKQTQDCVNKYSSATKTNTRACNATEKSVGSASSSGENVIEEKAGTESATPEIASQTKENTESSAKTGLPEITGAVTGSPQQKSFWPLISLISVVFVLIAAATLSIIKSRKKKIKSLS